MSITMEVYKPQFIISTILENHRVAKISLHDGYGDSVTVKLTKQDLITLQNLIAGVSESLINGATYNLGSDDLMIDMPENLKERVMQFMLKDK